MPSVKRDPEYLQQVAGRLIRVRQSLGLSLAGLCRALGVTPQRWQHWENANALPDVTVMLRLRTVFGITLDFVYAGDGSMLPLQRSNDLQAVKDRQRRMLARCSTSERT